MRSDNFQVPGLAGIMIAAIVLGAVSWAMIPDSDREYESNSSSPVDTDDTTVVVPPVEENSTMPDTTISNGNTIDSASWVPEGSPSSISKWTDGKMGSELNPDGKALWNQQATSTIDAKIGYNRLSWDNVFYDNLYGGGNVKLQVTMAFTDGGGWDCQRNADGIGYHGTWAPTTTTWVVTSETWNPRWTLGVTHSYSPDFAEQGSVTETAGLHYRTYG